MSQPLISIIVPIYKVESLLDTCVRSLIAQTYTNTEIILVDDGSPDRCGELCDEWAEKDARIRVVHKENGGLSDARNAGLAMATGEYIGFVDSDDWIEPRMYELLYNALCETDADIAECDRDDFSDEHPATPFTAEAITKHVYTAEQALAELIVDGALRQTVWNKLYRAELVTDPLFPVGKLNEDEFWTYKVFGQANTIVHIDAKLYHYYQREGSIIHVYTPKRLACLEAHKERNAYLKERYPALVSMATDRWLSTCMGHYQQMCVTPSVDPDGTYRKAVHEQFCAIDRKAAKAAVSMKYRVWYALFAAFPNATAKLRNTLGIGR